MTLSRTSSWMKALDWLLMDQVYSLPLKKKKNYLQIQEFKKDYFLENTLESLEWEMLFWGEEWDEEKRGLR